MDYNITAKRLKKLREETVLSPQKIKNKEKFIKKLSEEKCINVTSIDESYLQRFWKKGISHDILSIVLETNYNISITSASLKKYEKTNICKYIDGKEESFSYTKGMRVEYLWLFADFYDVPTDYLLGLTTSKHKDITIQQITDITGLSAEAIENLKQLHNIKQEQIHEFYAEINPTFIFDCMLSDINFTSIFPFHLLKYCKSKKEQFIEKISKERANFYEQYNPLGVAVNTAMERYFIINQIERFIDNIYDTYVKLQEHKEKINFKE